MFFPLFPFLCIIKGLSTHYFQFQYSLCAFSYSHENGDLSIEAYEVLNWGCEIIKANYVRKYGKVVHVYFNFTVKADHVAPYTSLFSLPCKPISMAEVLPPFFRRIDGTQIPTRYLSDHGVIQSTYTLDVSSDYVFEWVFICE